MTDESGESPSRDRGAVMVVVDEAVGEQQPHPAPLADAWHDRQHRLDRLEDLMVVQGRTKIPPAELRADWVQTDAALLRAGRPLARHNIRWVPRHLLVEFLTLDAMPLPVLAERRD